MSLTDTFNSYTPPAPDFIGQVKDWYDDLPTEDRTTLDDLVKNGYPGWKRRMYHAARANGLNASETRFRDFIRHLEATL